MSEANEQCSSFKTQLATLTDENENFKTLNCDLQKKTHEQDEQYSSLKTKLATLVETNENAFTEINNFEEKDNIMKNEIDHLKNSKQRSDNQLKSKEKQIDDLHTVINNLTSKLKDETSEKLMLEKIAIKSKKDNIHQQKQDLTKELDRNHEDQESVNQNGDISHERRLSEFSIKYSPSSVPPKNP